MLCGGTLTTKTLGQSRNEYFVFSRLRSQLFRPDEVAGEVAGDLSKTVDFDGSDFDVDFACLMVDRRCIPKLFGKVIISTSTCTSPFSFNLIKVTWNLYKMKYSAD